MNAWSREDIIIAYALYCVTPLGKINPSNKVIQQVAEIIPHSVASIVMRMRNFRYIDPKVSSGLKNVAKADRMIYEEFKHDWGSLSLEAETLTGLAIFDSSPLQGAKPLSSLTNHGKVSRERHFFKQAVLAAYDDRCFISGCALPQMLVASHIKPYSQCRSEADRVSPDNGICLNTFYDKAFDRGLITITPSMKKYDSAVYKRELKRNGIQIFYAAEAIPDGPEGIILESLMEGLAEYYSAELAQKIKRGMHESALKCQSTGSGRPLGYRVDEQKHFQIDPESAQTVQTIFEQYIKGESNAAICELLNSRGLRTALSLIHI